MRRIRITRDLVLLVALFVALAGFTAFVVIRQQQIQEARETFVPYSSHSARDAGTLALYEWLAAIGYHPERIENQAFQIGDEARFLFLVAPTEDIERDEVQYILNWVERGNTLFVADDSLFRANEIFREIQVGVNSLDHNVSRIVLSQPLSDASSGALVANAYNALEFSRDEYVTYAEWEGKPILARLTYGKGAIWLTSAPSIVTNDALRDENNARFALALFSDLPRGSVIAFDEYHLGHKPDTTLSLQTAIYNTPWGWGVIFSFVVLFGYLALNGKRFGRIMPVPKTLARRSPSEYVVSMANLFRRANKRGMVLNHYRQSLKRRLGRPYHLNPELSDERYIEMIARLRPELDRKELTRLLNDLRRSDTSEADLVKTVEQAVKFGARSGQGFS